MNNVNILEQLRQCFIDVIPKTDARTVILPLEFVINIIFCYLGDTECVSLEAILWIMKSQTEKNVKKSSFWERLSRKRLKKLLRACVSRLLMQLGNTAIICGKGLLKQLGVTDIYLIDSTTFTLWDGAKDDFPGTKT